MNQRKADDVCHLRLISYSSGLTFKLTGLHHICLMKDLTKHYNGICTIDRLSSKILKFTLFDSFDFIRRALIDLIRQIRTIER